MERDEAKRKIALAKAYGRRSSENQDLVSLFGSGLTNTMLDYAEGPLFLPLDHSTQVDVGASCQPENRLELAKRLSALLDDPQTRVMAIDALLQAVELLIDQRLDESQPWDSFDPA